MKSCEFAQSPFAAHTWTIAEVAKSPPLATDIATGLNLCSHLFGDMNANGEHGSLYMKGHGRPARVCSASRECRGALPDYLLSVTRILPAPDQATGL